MAVRIGAAVFDDGRPTRELIVHASSTAWRPRSSCRRPAAGIVEVFRIGDGDAAFAGDSWRRCAEEAVEVGSGGRVWEWGVWKGE